MNFQPFSNHIRTCLIFPGCCRPMPSRAAWIRPLIFLSVHFPSLSLWSFSLCLLVWGHFFLQSHSDMISLSISFLRGFILSAEEPKKKNTLKKKKKFQNGVIHCQTRPEQRACSLKFYKSCYSSPLFIFRRQNQQELSFKMIHYIRAVDGIYIYIYYFYKINVSLYS